MMKNDHNDGEAIIENALLPMMVYFSACILDVCISPLMNVSYFVSCSKGLIALPLAYFFCMEASLFFVFIFVDCWYRHCEKGFPIRPSIASRF